MELSHEIEITHLAEVRRAKAIENSPFGPVQKFGEAMMRDQVELNVTPRTEFSGPQHVFSGLIQGHGSAERTDLSDPHKPFFDM